jgi:hypothetical protein
MGRSRWTTRLNVESCLDLDVASFRRDGIIPTGPLGMADEVTWTLPSGVILGRLAYAIPIGRAQRSTSKSKRPGCTLC